MRATRSVNWIDDLLQQSSLGFFSAIGCICPDMADSLSRGALVSPVCFSTGVKKSSILPKHAPINDGEVMVLKCLRFTCPI